MVRPLPQAAPKRRSRSAEAARAVERARIERMSVRERILLALRLGHRAAALGAWRGTPDG
jgi:hypothetical protein